MRFDLLKRIEGNSDQNDNGRSAEKAGKVVIYGKDLHQYIRHNSYRSQHNGTRQCYAGKNIVEVFGRFFAGPDTGNESTVLFHIIRYFRGIERNGRVKVSEQNDNDRIDHPVRPVIDREPTAVHPLHILKKHTDRVRDENDGLRKNDGHYAGAVHAKRNMGGLSAIYFAADNLLGVLDRYLACSLCQEDDKADHDNQNDDQYDLNQQVACACLEHGDLIADGCGESGYDTDHNDQ